MAHLDEDGQLDDGYDQKDHEQHCQHPARIPAVPS